MAERLGTGTGLSGPACYFPYFRDRRDALNALKPYVDKNGYYLIRNSTSKPNTFSISVTHQGGICHMNVMHNENNNFYLQGNIEFHGMSFLLSHYKLNDVPNEQSLKCVRFVHPVTKLENGILGDTVPNPRRWTTGDIGSHNKSGMEMRKKQTKSDVIDRAARPMGRIFFEDVRMRPPEPLPTESEATPLYMSHKHYTVPDLEYNRLPGLRRRMENNENRLRCVCGLLIENSKFPCGWEVHISDDQPTKGRVFFVSPDSRSHWSIPESVRQQLNDTQRAFLSELCLKDHFLSQNLRNVRSRHQSDSG